MPIELLQHERWYDDLCRRIHDPNYDIAGDGFRVIEEVRDFIIEDCQISRATYDDRWMCNPLVEDMLLRVRNVSAAVFAMSVGQFPGYDTVEDRWRANGYRDILGFTWLAPR